jgi:hypothetical protein
MAYMGARWFFERGLRIVYSKYRDNTILNRLNLRRAIDYDEKKIFEKDKRQQEGRKRLLKRSMFGSERRMRG